MSLRAKYLIPLFLLLIWTSCTKQSKVVLPLLEKAEEVVQVNPDSALTLLEQVHQPKALRKALYYRYFLIQIQAKDKNYQDISGDTLVYKICKYYRDRADVDRAMLATYYCGRILEEQQQFERAQQIYLAYQQFAHQFQNNNLKGLFESSIAYLFYQQFLFEEAINHYRIAAGYFRTAENFKNEITVYQQIGSALLIHGDQDSAFNYFNQSLKLADSLQIKSLQCDARNNLGAAFQHNDQWQNAAAYYREAWSYTGDSLEQVRLAANMAGLYINQSMNDSARIYLEKAVDLMSENMDNSIRVNIYLSWSSLEENEGNAGEALELHKLYSKYLAEIIDENRINAVLEVEKKYNYQLLENQNIQLKIRKQRWLIISLGFMLVLLISFTILLRRFLLKEKELKEMNFTVAEIRQMALSYNEKEQTYHNILLKHFDILKKASLLEGFLRKDELKKGKEYVGKFNSIVYGKKELEWVTVYKQMNEITHGQLEQLKGHLYQLDELEFRICCLTYLEFSNTEIGILLKYTVNTIQTKKSAVRKKLNIAGQIKTRDFLCELLLVDDPTAK